MKFVWKMEQADWERLISNHAKKDDKNFSETNDLYGQCMVGHLCADIQHTLDHSAWYTYVNVFGLRIDEGYGETNSGIPYALLDDGPTVPISCNSLEEFKSEFEKIFEEYIEKNERAKQLAEMELGNWD